MPAYNAALTLERTYREIPLDIVDEVIVTDDASSDQTVAEARKLGLRTLVHEENRGYGANQKTCYTAALELGADVAVMLCTALGQTILSRPRLPIPPPGQIPFPQVYTGREHQPSAKTRAR